MSERERERDEEKEREREVFLVEPRTFRPKGKTRKWSSKVDELSKCFSSLFELDTLAHVAVFGCRLCLSLSSLLSTRFKEKWMEGDEEEHNERHSMSWTAAGAWFQQQRPLNESERP